MRNSPRRKKVIAAGVLLAAGLFEIWVNVADFLDWGEAMLAVKSYLPKTLLFLAHPLGGVLLVIAGFCWLDWLAHGLMRKLVTRIKSIIEGKEKDESVVLYDYSNRKLRSDEPLTIADLKQSVVTSVLASVIAAGIVFFVFRRTNWLVTFIPNDPRVGTGTVGLGQEEPGKVVPVVIWRVGVANKGNSKFTNVRWSWDSQYEEAVLDKENEVKLTNKQSFSHNYGPMELDSEQSASLGLSSKGLTKEQTDGIQGRIAYIYFFGAITFDVGSTNRATKFCYMVHPHLSPLPCEGNNQRVGKP